MAFLRKKHDTFFAVFSLADGSRAERSTKQKDRGTPAERAESRRRAIQIAQCYEETARGNATEAQIRKSVGDIFQKVSGRRIDFAKTDVYLRAWLERVKLHKAPGTWTRYEVIVRDFLSILGAKASLPLGDITVQDAQAFIDAKAKAGLRAASLRLCAKTLNTPFNRALREGLILTNPLQAIDLPEGRSAERQPFAWPQVAQLVAIAEGDWKTAVLLGAFTGARLGDCVSLTWRAVDWEQGVICFLPQKTAKQGREIRVPIHPALATRLRSIGNYVDLADPAAALDKPLCPELARRVIAGRSGLSREFIEIMARAGIHQKQSSAPRSDKANGRATARAVPLLSFHSLRHTFVTMLANAGVPPDVRQALAGHSSERMSERYTHRGIALLKAAVRALPEVQDQTVPVTPPDSSITQPIHPPTS